MTNICKRYDDFISNLFIFMPTFIQKGWELFGLLPLTYYWE